MSNLLTNLINLFDFEEAVFVLKKTKRGKTTATKMQTDIMMMYQGIMQSLVKDATLPENGSMEASKEELRLTIEYVDRKPVFGKVELVLVLAGSVAN